MPKLLYWIVGLVISFSIGLPTPAVAQKNEAAALNARVDELSRTGRYAEAISLAQRALAVTEKARGLEHPSVATSLNNLASLYQDQGRYADAEPLYKRSLAIWEKVRDPDHPDVATALNNLAELYRDQGRYADAEPLYKRSLAIGEKTLGFGHPDVAGSLNNLASLYHSKGRYRDAEPLYRRALTIKEKVFGPDHRSVAVTLNNLASLYQDEGRYADAEPLYRRSLAIREKVFGPSHPEVSRALNNLADLYHAQGRITGVEALYKRSLAIWEKLLGPDHPDVATALNNLAGVYHDEGRYADAEPLYKRSLAIREKVFGPSHPGVAVELNNLASLYQKEGRTADALPVAKRAIGSGRVAPSIVLSVLFAAQRENLISPDSALNDSLNMVQRVSQTSTASAVNKLAVRLAAGDDRLAQLVRKDQDLAAESDTLDKAFIAAASKEPSKRDASAEQRSKQRLATIVGERAALQKVFATEFPGFAALSNPLPMTTREIQSLLSGDEAMVLFSVSEKESYVFALTRDSFDWNAIPVGSDALSQKVAAFRRGLDLDKIADTASGKAALFDLRLANELYGSLFGPVEALIKDKMQLLIVPSGALTALPFNLLVTEKPEMAVPDKLDGYRDAAWLIKRQAVSVLPSVASLKALRGFARSSPATKPLIGFGDPIFDFNKGIPGDKRTAAATKSATRNIATGSYTDFWQGAGVDRNKLAQSLPQLPDTADELNAVALKLGAPASDIHLGSDASETTVKRAPLADYSIVYFATHGLVAGDVKGLAEPSLVLSIPRQPTELDDGLLTSSEVAQLKLNADWVVLSACNTIAGDKPGAEALSGLARSFFYAGARALLVSHWAVDSAAATRLTTSTFDRLKADPKLGRAEALRQSMLAYLNDASSPRNAYPAFWAPFALIGEGATR